MPDPEFSIGLNLAALRDYSTDAIYDNAAAYLRRPGVIDQPWNPLPGLTLDASRNPAVPCGFFATFGGYPGQPLLTYSGPGNASLSPIPGPAWQLKLAPPVHDLRITFRGSDGKSLFRAGAVSDLAHASVLRMMDVQEMNNSPSGQWSERTPAGVLWKTANDDFKSNGAPLEDLIDLANAAHADPWFCIPDTADDDWVSNFAKLLHQRLASDLHPMLELSNEVWLGWPQQARVMAAAAANPTLTFTLNSWGRAAQQQAFRTVAVAKLVRAEFGADAGRVRMILGGQASASPWLETALAWFDAAGLKASDYLYAVAIAPYVGDSWTVPQVDQAGLTVDSLFDLLNAELQGPVSQWIGTHKALADKYGLRLVAYEGGQGISGTANLDVKLAAQRDPRMGKLQTDLLNLWRDKGGSAFALFYYAGPANQYGAWGLKESADQQHTAKWDAFVAAADAVNGKTPATVPTTQPTAPPTLLQLFGQVRSLTAERDALKAQVQALQGQLQSRQDAEARAVKDLQGP